MTKTANQNIMPVTVETKDNDLYIGGCKATDLAENFGTPLYVYDKKTITDIAKQYKSAFKAYENTQMLFASKAFMTKATCHILHEQGFGFDVVSGGEIYTAYKSNVDMSKCLFNGNNKSIDELEMALDLGIGRISVDNFLELALLDNIAKSKEKTVDILLRITPGIECHTHEYIQTGHLDSKFGFDLTQLDEAIEQIQDEYSQLKIKGLHAHLGSQIFETNVYADAIEVTLNEFARIKDKFGIELEELNIGGGLGITYTHEDDPPSINEIADVIINAICDNTSKLNLSKPKLYIEPGRSIVGTSGVTLYTVGSSKQVPNGRKYVAVDGGMADNPRPSMYQAKYEAVIANKVAEEPKETVTIAGRFCESGDILIKDVILPEIETGDIICIFNTGAYAYSMSSNYNRVLKPAAIIVEDGNPEIIIKRETYDDLIQHDVIPQSMLCKA